MRVNLAPACNIVCLSLLGLTNASAAVNDVLPADYFPLAKGTSTLALYAYDRHASGPFADGTRQMNGRLDTRIGVLRAGHFFELAGKPLSIIAVLPWAKTEAEPLALSSALGGQATGLADLRLGATSWLVARREHGRFLGLTGIASFPTGDYDRHRIINIGENRYKFTLNLGWIESLGKSIFLELTPEAAWFGDNTDFDGHKRLEQKPSYALTGVLRYRASPNWQFHVGGQINAGGETRIDHIDQDDAANNTRVMLGATLTSDDRKHQWIARLARDTTINGGFRTDSEFLLRYLWIF